MYEDRVLITDENFDDLYDSPNWSDEIADALEVGASVWSCGLAIVISWPDGRALLFDGNEAEPGRVSETEQGVLVICDTGAVYDEEGNEIYPEDEQAH